MSDPSTSQQRGADAAAAPAVAAAADAADGAGAARRRVWLRRAFRVAVGLVQAALALEAVGWAYQALSSGRGGGRRGGGGGGASSSEDPADLLVAYLTGADDNALAGLDTDAMARAVDALDTSDYEEIGCSDGGAELRAAVEDMIIERQKRRRARERELAAAAAEGGGGAAAGAGAQKGGGGGGTWRWQRRGEEAQKQEAPGGGGAA